MPSMCGRFRAGWGAIKRLRHYGEYEKAAAAVRELLKGTRFNISPSQTVLAVRTCMAEGGPDEREFFAARWGLVPSWSKEPKTAYATFNARIENVAASRMFAEPLRRRRCLVLADGWYEWRAQDGKKQPYLFQEEGARPFAFAGLWDRWSSKETGEILESCTILVGPSSRYMAQVHNRMPVRVAEGDYGAWLDPRQEDAAAALAVLSRTHPGEVLAYPVSSEVNRGTASGPQLAEPIGPPLA